jgi:hypothetical protein
MPDPTGECAPPVLLACTDAAISAKVLTATQHWLERAVIGLNLCPFAKRVFVKKQVRYALTAATTADQLPDLPDAPPAARAQHRPRRGHLS